MGEKPFKNPKILNYLSSSTLNMYEQSLSNMIS